jgi:ribonuclease HII
MIRKVSLTTEFEMNLLNQGYESIIGIDEVGRGCWAGPVAIGVFRFDINHIYNPNILINDSKKLSMAQREDSYKHLSAFNHAILWGEVSTINELGIGKTIEMLISDAVNRYWSSKTLILIDGQFSKDFGTNTKKLIKGDSTYYSIASASILAKVERDRLMTQLSQNYPLYNFEKHKGYGTKNHIEALNNFGITEIHRTNYKPIMNLLKKN